MNLSRAAPRRKDLAARLARASIARVYRESPAVQSANSPFYDRANFSLDDFPPSLHVMAASRLIGINWRGDCLQPKKSICQRFHQDCIVT